MKFLYIIWFLIILSCLATVTSIMIVFFIRNLHDYKTKCNSNLTNLIKADDEVGKYFTECMENNILKHVLETSKHIKDFPDNKQLESFEKYSNQEISDALNDICDFNN